MFKLLVILVESNSLFEQYKYRVYFIDTCFQTDGDRKLRSGSNLLKGTAHRNYVHISFSLTCHCRSPIVCTPVFLSMKMIYRKGNNSK